MPRVTTLLLIALLASVGCDARTQQSSSGGSGGDRADDAVAIAKEVDSYAAEELAGSKLNAKQWLAAANHMTFDTDKNEIVKLTDDCLAAGAVGVWVGDAEDDDNNTKVIDHLFIELPTDAAKRARIFQLYNKWNDPYGDAEKDVGQKYLSPDWS